MDNTAPAFLSPQAAALPLLPQRDARKQPPTELYLRKRLCQYLHELRIPNLASPRTVVHIDPQGSLLSTSHKSATGNRCSKHRTRNTPSHSKCIRKPVLMGGDAQRPSSDRSPRKALDDGRAVGHRGYSSSGMLPGRCFRRRAPFF